MEKLPEFNEFLNEGTLNEGVASLDSYYSNSDKSIREYAKKIDAILNQEIKSLSTKKEIIDLITELVDEYASEYADNKRPW